MLLGVSQGLEFRFSVPFLPVAGLVATGAMRSCHCRFHYAVHPSLAGHHRLRRLGYLEVAPCARVSLVYFSSASVPRLGLALAGNADLPAVFTTADAWPPSPWWFIADASVAAGPGRI